MVGQESSTHREGCWFCVWHKFLDYVHHFPDQLKIQGRGKSGIKLKSFVDIKSSLFKKWLRNWNKIFLWLFSFCVVKMYLFTQKVFIHRFLEAILFLPVFLFKVHWEDTYWHGLLVDLAVLGLWLDWILKIFSHLNHSMILWLKIKAAQRSWNLSLSLSSEISQPVTLNEKVFCGVADLGPCQLAEFWNNNKKIGHFHTVFLSLLTPLSEWFVLMQTPQS